jgi:hypothetical protein
VSLYCPVGVAVLLCAVQWLLSALLFACVCCVCVWGVLRYALTSLPRPFHTCPNTTLRGGGLQTAKEDLIKTSRSATVG